MCLGVCVLCQALVPGNFVMSSWLNEVGKLACRSVGTLSLTLLNLSMTNTKYIVTDIATNWMLYNLKASESQYWRCVAQSIEYIIISVLQQVTVMLHNTFCSRLDIKSWPTYIWLLCSDSNFSWINDYTSIHITYLLYTIHVFCAAWALIWPVNK